jgi:hypothetical protein
VVDSVLDTPDIDTDHQAIEIIHQQYIAATAHHQTPDMLPLRIHEQLGQVVLMTYFDKIFRRNIDAESIEVFEGNVFLDLKHDDFGFEIYDFGFICRRRISEFYRVKTYEVFKTS